MSDPSPPPTNIDLSAIINQNHIDINRISFGSRVSSTATMMTETAMKKAVKGINFGRSCQEKREAAAEIGRLAKLDKETRTTLGELGVITALVTMVVDDDDDDRCRTVAVEALVQLTDGSFRNKKLLVEAGLLSHLPKIWNIKSLVHDHRFALLLLSISSLAKSQYPLSSTNILQFLVKTLLSTEQMQEKLKLMRLDTLYNLSTKLDNIKPISTSGAVHALLASCANKTAAERALATLGNLVHSAVGKRAIEDDPLVPEAFIEILSWDDCRPKCQELATYLLMTLAHRSRVQRAKMMELGVVNVLLKVALLGSEIARKRAFGLLQWFKDEKGMIVHSGPQERGFALSRGVEDDEDESEKRRREVKRMVKQSLDKNMELIVTRAKGVKALVASSSSKSLPF